MIDENFNQKQHMDEFDSIRISVSSPEDIEKQSFGEITKPETINYRTQKPEKDGLFDERIFGPVKDYECYCGKYKKIRYKGVICDKCGVEVTRSSVRRERMGHIKLAVPTCHIWYFRGNPSPIGLVLGLTSRELERVVYFGSYIVLDVDEDLKKQAFETLEKEYAKAKGKLNDPEEKDKKDLDVSLEYQMAKNELNALKPNTVISESKYVELSMKYGQIAKVGIGAEAIYELLKQINLKNEIEKIQEEAKAAGAQDSKKTVRRLQFLKNLIKAKIKPEWMVLENLPVLPPDLRPMVQLDGGRFAASDLNDLYRRVINRNNRLKRLLDSGAPEVICRNEKRMLQEAVDALIDNSAKKEKAVTTTAGRRQLKSLSDMLKGKQGRFRQNLLGKRVDYSGRSVIVVGPDLKLNECGLPKAMALELFKPFVISKLISGGYAHNVKNATRLIETNAPEIWDILERIIKKSYVLLNRAPTLHRLGIQAFKPKLIEGKSIEIHPFVCAAYNADFDGDQMAVYLPLSEQALYESKEMMQSITNLRKPASGDPIVTPTKDVVIGLYYLTKIDDEENVKPKKYFASKEQALRAWNENTIHIKDKIIVIINNQKIETSVGRILLNQEIPGDEDFINKEINNKELKKLVSEYILSHKNEDSATLIDALKDLGFYWGMKSGLTFAAEDIKIPANKKELLKQTNEELAKIYQQYQQGLISDNERYLKVVDLWEKCKSQIEESMLKTFTKDNPIFEMVTSGARGTISQLTQIAGMKGLVANPAGKIIELPVESNYKEGLSEFEYFISSHGARKGRADTALRTSDSGYLTRRLVDVAQDVVVNNVDCGTKKHIFIKSKDSEYLNVPFAKRIEGRTVAEIIKDPKNNEIIVKKDNIINKEAAEKIEQAGIETLAVYSVMTCENQRGVCKKCYGLDLGRGEDVDLGTSVGIIAAQAIGEPGTQLTMRTFHLGGIAGTDITQGLPRIEEIFEARAPKTPAIICDIDGRVSISQNKGVTTISVISKKKKTEEYQISKGYQVAVKNGENVKKRQVILTSEKGRSRRAIFDGAVILENDKVILTANEFVSREYQVSENINIKVENGDEIVSGTQLTEGHWNLNEALRLLGREKVQKYILREVLNIYASQGQTINEKHIELIIKQMFSKVRILHPGESRFLPGEIVSKIIIEEENASLKKDKKQEIKYEEILLGISTVAINTESFLSAASFQETTSVLIKAATAGKIDKLKGLKENVIIGRTIPAGTSYEGSRASKKMQKYLAKKAKKRQQDLIAKAEEMALKNVDDE